MRTLISVPNIEKRLRKAKETMEIYAPLANRMGMNRIRDELEDLSFAQLNPDPRKLIVDRLSLNKNDREKNFYETSKKFEAILKASGINSKIIGREKTPFSIWKKMQSKRVSLEQLTDVIGFRIIVDDIKTCYETLGIFHSKWLSLIHI